VTARTQGAAALSTIPATPLITVVEEWLNREGFFTIRGVKHGVGEMDLLAVQPQKNGGVIGWHVEVQISFRPVGFISKLGKDSGSKRSSARKRSFAELDKCARAWVDAKFRSPAKARLRDRIWPGINWEFHLVHGIVRESTELKIFASEGVILHPFHEILFTLCTRASHSFSASAGGDLAEIVSYYKKHVTEESDR
jgi:hypothetical protein